MDVSALIAVVGEVDTGFIGGLLQLGSAGILAAGFWLVINGKLFTNPHMTDLKAELVERAKERDEYKALLKQAQESAEKQAAAVEAQNDLNRALFERVDQLMRERAP